MPDKQSSRIQTPKYQIVAALWPTLAQLGAAIANAAKTFAKNNDIELAMNVEGIVLLLTNS